MILFTATQGAVLACIAAIGKWSEVPAEDQLSANIVGAANALDLHSYLSDDLTLVSSSAMVVVVL